MKPDSTDPHAGDPAQPRPWRRHKFLNYQGYSFPWYITLIWITFVTLGLWYLVKNILFK